jgi:hypothetical protein
MSQVMIPIVQGTTQAMTCTLPVNGGNVTLTFQFTYNTPGGYWFLSITDSNSNLLLDALPLICGSPPYDVLACYQYLQIGSAYVVPTSSGLPDIPDFNTLGTSSTNPAPPTFQLVWTDNFNYIE